MKVSSYLSSEEIKVIRILRKRVHHKKDKKSKKFLKYKRKNNQKFKKNS